FFELPCDLATTKDAGGRKACPLLSRGAGQPQRDVLFSHSLGGKRTLALHPEADVHRASLPAYDKPS
ncbi:hypothetical protein, partial [Methylobacterium sp. WL116]|uniref:hypothetical protein n=1 Tax=Methylobacterium sp. WL116 TaxID=2603889 RepID=UPI001AEDBD42